MHVLFHFGIGGLENGVVNLINGFPAGRYRHVIVCLNDYDRQFARRLRDGNVEFHALHKRPGHDFGTWRRAWQLLREIRPQVLHTRNFVSLEFQLLGLLCGVRGRVHGEHGWDMQDLGGVNRKHRLARRLFGACVQRFIALSRDLERYLVDDVGIAPDKVMQIYNGVDVERFHPVTRDQQAPLVIGTVGRMKAVKNQTFLCRAFIDLLSRRADLVGKLRLRMVGDGPLRAECDALLAAAGLRACADLIGESDQVADEMRAMDIFVLPSLAEGISNTILEAMATSLPVIATAVGGNPELIVAGQTGALVACDDIATLSATLERYVDQPALRRAHGEQGRAVVTARFSLARMVATYDDIYRELAA
ncbi:MAG: TIGR03088 family PEP-CTERM/XrtA system glycosyltransferase [Proteobacteria bacterium]|nr:TIGR03088 family PEP-CTERM/XrtA system glycosyltransferase [Pseudomonadota bacterium]